MDITTHQALFEGSADALDAAVCVLSARDFLQGRAMAPQDHALAEREGLDLGGASSKREERLIHDEIPRHLLSVHSRTPMILGSLVPSGPGTKLARSFLTSSSRTLSASERTMVGLVREQLVTQVVPGMHLWRVPRFASAFLEYVDRHEPIAKAQQAE